ncbi:MAG TPA: regulatory protein RecX [Casimicrobiaceae bacterium]|nr:regulatory protein RecX [Casimicrobiaceae bacterium]
MAVRARTPLTLRQRAIALLARRDYARAELASRLAREGASDVEIDALVDELTTLGYLSDARVAAALVQQRGQRFGARAIAHALRAKGIDAEAAKTALASLDRTQEFANGRALWERRFGTAPRSPREKAAQLRFLLSRGFSRDVASRVLRFSAAAVDEEQLG